MERDHYTESKRFSRALGITSIAFRVTIIVFLATSLTLLVTNVLRVPYAEDEAVTIHFYDNSGFKSMLYTIAILIGYSVLQILFTILQLKDNRHPNFLCFYCGEMFSSIFLFAISLEGFISTRVYQVWLRKWLGDAASEYRGYFVKSYASASMLLLALICNFMSLIVFSCLLLKRNLLVMNGKKSSKVNVVVDEP